MLFCPFDKDGIDTLLHLECLAIGFQCRVRYLVTLQLEVVVVAPDVVEPFDGLLCSCYVAVLYLPWHFATDAGGADDKAFVEQLKVFMVGAGSHVEAVDPGARDELDEIVIAFQVLGQHDKVPARLELFAALAHVLVAVSCHVHLAAEDRLERLQPFLLPCLVDILAIIVQLLDAKHVAVVRESQAAHSVLDGFVHHALDARLSVEERVLGVDMKVYEVLHSIWEIES